MTAEVSFSRKTSILGTQMSLWTIPSEYGGHLNTGIVFVQESLCGS
jgi:hypothetical protein